eukprot:PRCOL_00004821-RA
MSELLANEYMEVGAELLSRAHAHCLDPPVLSFDGFADASVCAAVADAAAASGALVRSRVGAGEFGATSENVSRRTSSSVLVNADVAAEHPQLGAAVDELQALGRTALVGGGGWTTPGVLPPPGAFCYETTQLARYEPGQHFLEHEDAFPVHDARAQGFQRRATLLVYLNTPEGGGGTTRFEKVGCEVSPREGRALLFFPARGGELAGAPDARTLHTATDAGGEKWIAQLWVGWGMPAVGRAPPPPPQRAAARDGNTSAKAGKPKPKVKRKKRGGGFGGSK